MGVAKLNMLDRFLADITTNKGVKKEMKSQSEMIEIGMDETALPLVKKQRKPRSSSKQVTRRQPKEIIQVVLNTENETKESAEIMVCRDFNGDDMAELIGKLLAGTDHSYSVELKISQTK